MFIDKEKLASAIVSQLTQLGIATEVPAPTAQKATPTISTSALEAAGQRYAQARVQFEKELEIVLEQYRARGHNIPAGTLGVVVFDGTGVLAV